MDIEQVSQPIPEASRPTKLSRPRTQKPVNKALEKGFPPFLNQQSLREAITLTCAKFGTLKTLIIFPAKRISGEPKLHCLCHVRFDSRAMEIALRKEFKVFAYINGIGFYADVDDNWDGPRI